MEALFFRSLVRDIPPLLLGRRLEQIHSPQTGWWTLRLQQCAHPRFLLFAHHPSPQALALVEQRPENPASPPARAMWLRKRIRGQRIIAVQSDWSARRLALGLGRNMPDTWLILDARSGLALEADPPIWNAEPAWPTLAEILQNQDIWQSYPHISPLLRKTLALLPESEGASLYAALRDKHQLPVHVYEQDQNPLLVCPWPLPAQLCRNARTYRFDSALQASGRLAASVFFPSGPRTLTAKPAAPKKQARLLRRLDADEQRMKGYCSLAEQAQVLRTHLYQLPAHARLKEATLVDPDDQLRVIKLDPRKTVLENMEQWFRLAEKGRRGLVHVRRRRAEALSLPPPPPAPSPAPRGNAGMPENPKGNEAPKDFGLALHRFSSSDGFSILRGKNRKANHQLLTRLARPVDIWFHAEHGPGAHVILKRDHARQEVPEQSMREAAILAGLASHFADAGRASVICAEVRHVHAVKGSPGLARVEKTLCTLLVDLDPDLESQLRAAAGI